MNQKRSSPFSRWRGYVMDPADALKDEKRDGGKILRGEYPGIHRYIITSSWMGGKQNGCPLLKGSHLIKMYLLAEIRAYRLLLRTRLRPGLWLQFRQGHAPE